MAKARAAIDGAAAAEPTVEEDYEATARSLGLTEDQVREGMSLIADAAVRMGDPVAEPTDREALADGISRLSGWQYIECYLDMPNEWKRKMLDGVAPAALTAGLAQVEEH